MNRFRYAGANAGSLLSPAAAPSIPPRLPGSIVWDLPTFWGYSQVAASSINPGTVWTTATTGEAPLAIRCSARNTTAVGSLLTSGKPIKGYQHLEHRWTVRKADGSPIEYAGEIIDPNSKNTANPYTDKIGGELTVIIHEPGNFEIVYDVAAANGVTAQTIIPVTVTEPTANRLFFDGTGGSDLNDGRDPLGLSLANAVFTHATRTLEHPGLAAYDHAAATSQVYLTDNSNWIYLTWNSGANSGVFRIESKPTATSIVFSTSLGADFSDVSSSDGPRASFDPALDMADDTTYHFAAAQTYTINSVIATENRTGQRFVAYGSGANASIKVGGNHTLLNLSNGGSENPCDLVHLSRITLDGSSDVVGAGGHTMTGLNTNSASTGTVFVVLDRCYLFNSTENRVVSLQNQIGNTEMHFIAHGTSFDNRRTAAEPVKASTVYLAIYPFEGSDAFVGCTFFSEADSSLLDHHVYPTGEHQQRDRCWNDGGANVGGNVNMFFNENNADQAGTITRYITHFGNRYRYCQFGITYSNTNNNRTQGLGDDVILIGNCWDGSEGLIEGGIFWASTISAFIKGNLAVSLSRNDLYEVWSNNSDPANEFVLEANYGYDCRVCSIQSDAGDFEVIGNYSQVLGASDVALRWASAVNGADTFIQGNTMHAPNNPSANIINNTSVGLGTVDTLNAFANNNGNVDADPGFSDPASDDYRLAQSTALDVRFEVVEFNLQTGTPPFTQVISLSPGFGVPKGVIFRMSADRTDGFFGYPNDGYGNGSFTIGYSDGVNEVCLMGQHDSEGPPNPSQQKCFHALWEKLSIRLQSTNNNGVQISIAVDEFREDEVVLRYDDAEGETFEACMLVIGGADVDVVVGSASLGTGIAPVPINAGHATDVFLSITDHDSVFNDYLVGDAGNVGYDLNADISEGIAINDAGRSQMTLAWYSPDKGSAPAENSIALYDDAIIAAIGRGGVENYTAALTAFTATGVEITPSASAGGALLGFMSLSFNGSPNLAMVSAPIPTAGDIDIDTIGFQPAAGIWFNVGGPSAYNTPTDTSFSLSMTFFDSTEMHSVMVNSRDGVSNTDGSSGGRQHGNLCMMGVDVDSRALDVDSSGYTLKATGLEVTMTDWPIQATLGRLLVIGA